MNSIPIDFVGCNVRQTDRMAINYELTKGEHVYALFCVLLTTFGGLFMLLQWMIKVATN